MKTEKVGQRTRNNYSVAFNMPVVEEVKMNFPRSNRRLIDRNEDLVNLICRG